MKKTLLSLLLLLFTFSSNATHIVGGEIQYEHLGGASYRLTVNLYRDCDPASVQFPNTAIIRVDRGDGTFFNDFSLPLLSRDTLSPPLDTCAIDPGICVEEAIYSSIVNLPPGTNGYHLYSQYCCRNWSILNITTPGNIFETFYAYVPDNNIYLTNSSPVISNFPPVFVCNNQDLSLDFGATDLDGDSLVYSFYAPHNGDNGSFTFYSGISYGAGTPPNNWQSTPVNYVAGYSVNSPLDPFGGPGLSINPSTGFITGSPVATGQYVVGVQVDEYRDGVLIGRITRDFQFNVINCPPPQQAAIGPTDGCSGTAITFVNNSGAGANGFYWDFDTGSPNTVPSDTSTLFQPSHTYPSLGIYNVMLIAQKGTACADTAYYTLNVSGITPNFNVVDTICVGEVFSMTDMTTVLSGSVNQWDWDFGDGNTSNVQNPNHSYGSSGDYPIELIVYSDVGCVDSITKIIHARLPPQAGIVAMPGCNGLSVNFTSSSDASASGFWWSFGTGFPADTANTQNSSFIYSSYGNYNVVLVTQKGTACADTAFYTISLTEIIPDFAEPDTVCVNSVVNFIDQSTVSSGTLTNWNWDFGDGGSSTAQNPSHGYSAAGNYPVQLIVTSDLGCVDSITKIQVVEVAPVAQIGPVDACSGLTVTFDNFSAPNATDFWWGFGTGNPADSSVAFQPTFTFPSYGTYNVTLIAQKATGCQTSDTYVLNLSELVADFTMVDTACVNSVVNFTDQTVSAAAITGWQWDFGDGSAISLNQNESHAYPIGGTYNVELVVASSVGCSDTIIKQLFIQGAVIVDAGLDTALCVASPSLTLNGQVTNANGGIWSGGAGVYNLNTSQLNATYNPSLAEILAGQTELILTSTGNGYCAGNEDTLIITYLADPTVDAGLDIDVCADSAYMDIEAFAENAFSTTWSTSGSGTFGNVNMDTTTYVPTAGDIGLGFVTLYINTQNNSGCPNAVDSLFIFFNPSPTVSITSTDTTCAGYDVLLQSNSSTGNGWWETLGDGDFTPSDTGVAAYYTNGEADLAIGSVDIVFHSLDNGGCKTVFDTTTIIIIPSPIVSFTSDTPCLGSASVFTDGSTSVEPITNWDWVFEPGQTSTDQNPTYVYGTPGFHSVELIVTSLNGCIDTLIQNVFLYDTPVANFVSPEPCMYGAVFIDSSTVSDTTIVSWTWNFDDGATSNAQNPNHPFDSEGVYDVTLTVVSFFGCTNSVTITTEIFPKPIASFTASPNPGEVSEDIVFTDQSTSANSIISAWEWDFADGDTSIVQNPINTYDNAGAFEVQLIVFDAEGCRDTVLNLINIMYGPDVPTAFSPNGDGENDFAMVLGEVFESIDFKIYNNWGEIIFQTNIVGSLGWDGTWKDEPQPMGVYVYTAIVTTADGAVVEISGDISLIR
jgi:gliding motility-associated-like protein